MPRRGWDQGYSFRSTDFAGDWEHEGTPCARGEHCASATRERLDDGTTVRTPVRCYQPFCQADHDIISECLSDGHDSLGRLWTRLAAAAGDFLTAEVSIRAPFGPQVPLRVDVDGLMRHMTDIACSWHERVAAVAGAGLSAPDTQRTRALELGARAGKLLEDACPKLAAHLGTLLARPRGPMMRPRVSWLAAVTPDAPVLGEWRDSLMLGLDGADAGNEILRLGYLARAALLETDAAPVRLLGVPCRSCDLRMLYRADPPQHDGDTEYHSRCSRCSDLMTPPEYAAWVRANAAYYGERVTPAMAAAGRVA